MSSLNKIEIYKELQRELDERKQKAERIYFTESYISIELDKANNCLYVDWKGYQTEQSVMTGCEKMLEALLHFGLSKVLNDNTNVVGIWTPAAKWVGENWFPRMKSAGLQQFAWVYSPSRLSQISTDESLKTTPTPDIIQTFYTIEEARSWLNS
ncbi:MAG TPA: hypothetical protein VEZ17_17920 [Chitinophagaceae bacterium]|jgi:hypothetical protein|nr:hypothetical protein [Chitinophagaceae bacterium]